MKPIEIACRHVNQNNTNCGAQAGQKCNWPQPWADLLGFHAERIEDAAAMSAEQASTPSAAAFDAAVEQSGRI